jgi:hypothetical protein
MRVRLVLVVAFATLFGFAAPASAATFVTTGTSCSGSVCFSLPARLDSFDSDLGTLRNIILDVEVDSQLAYLADFLSYDSSPAVPTGTAHRAYDAPFQVILNGVSYSLNITGEEDLSYTGATLPFLNGGVFHATGSKTFVIDQSLLDTFVDAGDCFGSVVPNQVCAIGWYPTDQRVENIVQSSDNLRFRNFDSAAAVRYTLTYIYRPVPEPATWAMMLLGFAGIGMTIRRRGEPIFAAL